MSEIILIHKINGILSNCNNRIVGEIATPSQLYGSIESTSVSSGYYYGEYDISPTTDGIILATSNKTLREDIVIKPIQPREVENDSGGITVIIG